jgi:Nitrous oxide-stimulated promoter.
MKKNRIETEKAIISKMVSIYCKGHKHDSTLCKDCEELVNYANQRLDNCKFGEGKSFCSKCSVHCYRPEMREHVKKVMKYSGPRIIFHNPVIALTHFFQK